MIDVDDKSRLHQAMSPLPPELRDTALSVVIAEFEAGEPVRSRSAMFRHPIERNRYVAIHNDDVEMLKESAAIAGAAIAGFPEPATAIGAAILLVYRARKKHILLDAPEARVLLVLRPRGSLGANRDEITRMLGDDPSVIDASLERLMTARRFDGTLAPLVEDSGGRFIAVDV